MKRPNLRTLRAFVETCDLRTGRGVRRYNRACKMAQPLIARRRRRISNALIVGQAVLMLVLFVILFLILWNR